jgi:hypothetical protein
VKIMSKVIKAVTSLFKKPTIPKIETPFMPDPGSTAGKLAAQAKVAKRKKEGREGTIYMGGAYTGSNLGGTV